MDKQKLNKKTLYLQRISPDDHAEIDQMLTLLIVDFPGNAHIPRRKLRKAIIDQVFAALYLTDGKTNYGYALIQQVKKYDAIYLQYFAVISEYRSYGLGSLFLQQINRLAKGRMFFEVEDPEDTYKHDEEYEIRKRRIAFYEKNGFHLHPTFRFKDDSYQMRLMMNFEDPGVDWLRLYHRLHNRVYGFPPLAYLSIRPAQ